MRRTLFALSSCLVLLVSFFRPVTVSADDYITDALNGLKDSSVYVHPDTENTDRNTKAELESLLQENDNIILVMLPSAAADNADILTMVKDLSLHFEDSRIIGLAVGREVIGYAPSLPAGIAADQMDRADSVSNDAVTALSTYVLNIHKWIKAHPQPTATPKPLPTPTPKPYNEEQAKTGKISFVAIFILLAVALLGFILIKNRKAPRSNDMAEDIRKAKKMLLAIRGYIDTVSKPNVRNLLESIYDVANTEIVLEIDEEPHRATDTTMLRIRTDLEEFSEVLRIYANICTGKVRLAGVDADLPQNLELIFFPKVLSAFQQIATQLDLNDVHELEKLVRSLDNEFTTRGFNQ